MLTILIYPEGITANGTRLMPFKQGAFTPLVAIEPFVEVPEFEPIGDCWSTEGMMIHVMIIFGRVWNTRKLIRMPVF